MSYFLAPKMEEGGDGGTGVVHVARWSLGSGWSGVIGELCVMVGIVYYFLLVAFIEPGILLEHVVEIEVLHFLRRWWGWVFVEVELRKEGTGREVNKADGR